MTSNAQPLPKHEENEKPSLASLLPVAAMSMDGENADTVYARDLYDALGLNTSQWARWCQRNILKNEFSIEGVDYVGFDRRSNGNDTTDYALTLQFAKKLAMMVRTEAGEKVRDYFLECERRAWKPHTPALSEEQQILLGYQAALKKVERLSAKVEELAPKAAFHDKVAEAINCQTVQELAKVLGTGSKRLFSFLRDQKLLMRDNRPYQRYLDAGYFRVVERQYNDERGESHTYTRTLVTGKGAVYIQKRLDGTGDMPLLKSA